MDNQEIWKDIIGYENYYKVSNLGNVRSLDRLVNKPNKTSYIRKGKLCNQSKSNLGYMTVGFTVNNVKTNKYVHRLVAEAFILNTDNKPQVNHINGDKTDNNIENLEWVSHRENLDHAIKNNLTLKGEENRNSKLKDVDVIKIHSLLQKGTTTKELSESYNISYSTIDGIRTNRYWKHLNLPKI